MCYQSTIIELILSYFEYLLLTFAFFKQYSVLQIQLLFTQIIISQFLTLLQGFLRLLNHIFYILSRTVFEFGHFTINFRLCCLLGRPHVSHFAGTILDEVKSSWISKQSCHFLLEMLCLSRLVLYVIVDANLSWKDIYSIELIQVSDQIHRERVVQQRLQLQNFISKVGRQFVTFRFHRHIRYKNYSKIKQQFLWKHNKKLYYQGRQKGYFGLLFEFQWVEQQNLFKILMESKEVSVKKLIRIHLKAQRKVIQQNKHVPKEGKSLSNVQSQKLLFKSPQGKGMFGKDKTQKYITLISSANQIILPSLNTAILEEQNFQSRKTLLENNTKIKSSSQITQLYSPREIVNKLKRIKSEQSIIANQKNDFMKKLSNRCKVYVKNPFQRKMSKNPNEHFGESKILNNQSELSQSGCQQLTKIIAFL